MEQLECVLVRDWDRHALSRKCHFPPVYGLIMNFLRSIVKGRFWIPKPISPFEPLGNGCGTTRPPRADRIEPGVDPA